MKKKNVVKLIIVLFFLFVVFCLLMWWDIYIPIKPGSYETITYVAERGKGDEDIAWDLQKQGIIKNRYFFEAYVVFSSQHSKLQAGKYILSPGMSAYQIVKKFVEGDVIKNKITIIEGWNIIDVAEYFEEKDICSKDDFIKLASGDYSQEFSFLAEKPKSVSLEGYLFPDT
ncbi:MAG: endolytic transglycosylase MltG, partial [bacterium]|nr:endolytic transglycosylase MltG [bacterium]